MRKNMNAQGFLNLVLGMMKNHAPKMPKIKVPRVKTAYDHMMLAKAEQKRARKGQKRLSDWKAMGRI